VVASFAKSGGLQQYQSATDVVASRTQRDRGSVITCTLRWSNKSYRQISYHANWRYPRHPRVGAEGRQ
jgi:hypothetical protein